VAVRLTYNEFFFWSPTFDEDAVRLSFYHAGQEYFAIVPAGGKWRDKREAAAQAMAQIIDEGGQAGEWTTEIRQALVEARLMKEFA
jgi:glycerol-3-phosphate dehydrogenase